MAVFVLLFALLALDLSKNNGEWFWTVNAWVDDILRAVGVV